MNSIYFQLHPDMPKRPLTAFFMFYKDKNKKYREKHPGASQPDISKQLSEKFKTMSEKKKVGIHSQL